jgi:Iap family predicted aminopeptidase
VDEFREVGSGVLLSGQQTVLLAPKYSLFIHFDEAWLYREAPMEPETRWITIVAPYNLSEEVPTEVVNWIYRSGCIVGLGDGDGLNYVTVDERVARQLSEY